MNYKYKNKYLADYENFQSTKSVPEIILNAESSLFLNLVGELRKKLLKEHIPALNFFLQLEKTNKGTSEITIHHLRYKIGLKILS